MYGEYYWNVNWLFLFYVWTPAHTPGSFALELTANDQDYTSQRLPYLFYSPTYMVNLDPVSGPAWSAGTALHIYGGNFFNTTDLSCRVADVAVPATYLSDTEGMFVF